MKRQPRYTFEECEIKTKSYVSYDKFKEECPDMFRFIKRHWWCKKLYSHMNRINKRLIYDIEECKTIISKYKTLKDFRINEPKIYGRIIRHKDKWLLKDLLPSESSFYRYIYVYEFKELNSAYIGLTWNIERRHEEHKIKGTVFKFITENNISKLDYPIILDGPITYDKSGEREAFFMKKYASEGWTLINKAPAGSLGGDVFGKDKVAIFSLEGNFIECITVKEASTKYNIKRHLIRLVMSGRNISTNGMRFIKEKDWEKMNCPRIINEFHLKNIEEKIVLLDETFNVINICKNKVEACLYAGYSITSKNGKSANNNLFGLKHNTIVNIKNDWKCVYYSDYEKVKNGELSIVKPNVKKCKTLLLLPEGYVDTDIKNLLEKPEWWKTQSKRRKEKRLKRKNELLERKQRINNIVQQYTLNGVLIKEYENVSIAARENNISVHALSSCVNYKTHTSGGFIWIYKDEFTDEILKHKINSINKKP